MRKHLTRVDSGSSSCKYTHLCFKFFQEQERKYSRTFCGLEALPSENLDKPMCNKCRHHYEKNYR